jgi:LPS export ABC transporter protein LptC
VELNADELPLIHTKEITSLISDSGITRYRLKTKQWDMYQNDTNSYWYFPQGIYVEQFDSLLQVKGMLEADTAYYYEDKSLWRVIGNVFMKNLDGVTFETEELFWNEKAPENSTNAIYSDKFVKVNTGDGIVYGVGLRSTLSMNHYTFYETRFETEIREENTLDEPINETANDTTTVNHE